MRMADPLTDALPDLVIMVRRDGVILGHMGGRAVPALVPRESGVEQRVEAVFPEALATPIRRSVRAAIAQRASLDTIFSSLDVSYEMRTSAQGPDRAICVIRAALGGPAEEAQSDEAARPSSDRRGFLRRFNDTLSRAAIQERPAAVALIHLDGVAEIARTVDIKVAEQVTSAAILRLPGEVLRVAGEPAASSFLGQLSTDILALAVESADRDVIESCVARVSASLREPVVIGDAAFHLTPYAGAAILGQDGISPRSLLDKARYAAAEARRSNSTRALFFTDTVKLRSLARLDVAREMREAIDNRAIHLRYFGRHDLASGRRVALVGYLRWTHPLRGELSPADFLGVAETTGLAPALSRLALDTLKDDFVAMASRLAPDTRISFGALRHHMLQEDFIEEVARFLEQGALPASRLELRIAERAFAALSPSAYQALGRLGLQIIVDQVGRGFSSLDRLARAPICGLQLDHAWVTALRRDATALRICRASISAATALGLTPIATGVDSAAQRETLLELGCQQGSGDYYATAAAEFDSSIMRPSSHAVA
jgi:diguanylate cyclase